MRRRLLLALVPLLLAPVSAHAVGVELPGGRVGVDVDLELDPQLDGGRAHLTGDLGALGIDNELSAELFPEPGEPPLPRLTNPPMFGAIGGHGAQFEELYGPPVANASLGTGGLTAGVGDAGVLTNLAWPGPGSPDHVSYLNITRGYPNEGAAENMGAFGGLLLPPGAGIDGRRVIWFTPTEGWTVVEQAYDHDESGTLRTVLSRAGITVTIRDVVHPTVDVLARRFDVAGAPDGSRLVHFANMDPTTGRIPRLPTNVSGVTDPVADVATWYDRPSGAMVHTNPLTVDPAAALVPLTTQPTVAAITRAVGATLGRGVHLAVAGDTPPVEHQAGLEMLGLLREETEGTGLIDPFYDAADGHLSGSPVAVGRTAGALAWAGPSGTVYIGAGASVDEAIGAVAAGRSVGFEGVAGASDADWAEWISRARLPAVADARTQAVAKRALMIIRTAQDDDTGAIVANTTSQTPYKQDWLRDGAFFNYALLLAGYPEMVAAHNDFYRRSQSIVGIWDPILCTDGAQCSAVFPFEIDAQGFGVWALWLEYEMSDQGPDDRARLAEMYGAIKAGAEILHACQDLLSDMQCHAPEDDNVVPEQTGQGAATVYLGLRSAASAARLVGDPADAGRWDRRADELRAAAREQLCSSTCNTGRGYMVWPGRVLTDPVPTPGSALDDALAATLDAKWRPFPARIAGTGPGYGKRLQYPMEALFSLATTSWRDQPGRDADLADAIEWLTHHLAAPGVLHYGERMYHLGGYEYLYSVGYPHIWSGAEVYIAAALVHGLAGCGPGEAAVGDAACR